MTLSSSAWSIVVLLLYVAFLALIVWGAVKLVQYLIRYGIDYYFKKLEESKKL